MSSFSVSPSIRAASLNSVTIDHQQHINLRAPPLTLLPQHQQQADQMLLKHEKQKQKYSRSKNHSLNNNSQVRASSTVSNIFNLGVANIPNGLEAFIFQHQEFAEKLLLPFEEDGIIEVKRKTVPLQLLRKIQLQVLAKKKFSANNDDLNHTFHEDGEKVQEGHHFSSSSPTLRWFRDNENKFFHQQHLQNELLARKEAKRLKKLRQRKALGFSPSSSSSSSSSSGDDDDDEDNTQQSCKNNYSAVANSKNKQNGSNDTDSRRTCGNTNSASRRSEAFENEMNFDFVLPTIIVGVTCLICNHQHSMESDFEAIHNVYLAELLQQQQNDIRRDQESPDSIAKSLLGISTRQNNNNDNNNNHEERQSSVASTTTTRSKISSASTTRSSMASSFVEKSNNNNNNNNNSLLRFANQRHSSLHRNENGERSQEHHQLQEQNSLLNSRTAIRTRESLSSLFSASSVASTSSAANNNNMHHQQRRSLSQNQGQPDDESKLVLLEQQEQHRLFMLQQHRQQQLAEVGCVLWAFKEHHQLLFPTPESANSESMRKFYSGDDASPSFLAAFWTDLVSRVRYHCASARHRAALVALHGNAEANAISRNYLTPTIPSVVSTKGTFLSNGAMTRMTTALHGPNRKFPLPNLSKVVPKQQRAGQNDNGGNNNTINNDNNGILNTKNNFVVASIKQRLGRRKQLQKLLDEMRKQRADGMNELKKLNDKKKNNILSLLHDENDNKSDSSRCQNDFSDFEPDPTHQQAIQQYIIHNDQEQLQLLIEQQTDIIDDVATNLDGKFVAAFLSENAYFHDDGRLLSSVDRHQVQRKHVNNNFALPPPRFVPREVIWINGYPALASRALGGDECFERGRRRFRNHEHYFDGNPNNGYLFLESYRDYKYKTRMLKMAQEAREHGGINNKKSNNNNNCYLDHNDENDAEDDDCLSNASNQDNTLWDGEVARSKSVASMSVTERPSTAQQEVMFFHKEQEAREKFQTQLQWFYPANTAASNASPTSLPHNSSRVVVNDSTQLITNKLSREYLLQFFPADKKWKTESAGDEADDGLSSHDEEESVKNENLSTKKVNFNAVDDQDSLLREHCVFVSGLGNHNNSENADLPQVQVNPGKYYRVSNVQSRQHRTPKDNNNVDIREEAKLQPKSTKVRFNGKNHLEAWVVFPSRNNETDVNNKCDEEKNNLQQRESGKRRQRQEENEQQELTQKLLQNLHHHHHRNHHQHHLHHHENDNSHNMMTRHERNTHERRTANKQKKDTIEAFVLSQQK